MVNTTAEEIEFRVYDELLDQIERLPDFEDVNIYSNREASVFSTRRFDIVITKNADRFPDELDQIENIEDWYPNKEFEVPVIEIEIKFRKEGSIDPSILNDLQLGTPSDGSSLPERYLVVHTESTDTGFSAGFQEHEYVINANLYDKSSIRKNVCHHILTEELAGFRPTPENHVEAKQIISSLESKIFHYNEVKALYQQDRIGPLIVLLSVYFESYCYEQLRDYLENNKPNPAAGVFFDEDDRFEQILDACRFYNIIEEDEFTVVNLIRDARNDYAHQLNRYHSTEETEIEEQDRLDDAIETYEKFVGVKHTMLDSM